MPAPLTDVAIANRALAKFGAGAITTMADVTPPGPAVRLQYETTIGELLSGYDWTFCKDTVQLSPISEPAGADGMLASGWRHVHASPSNLLKLPSKYLADPRFENAPVTAFQVQAGRVYSNEPALWAVAQFRAEETVWPPYFVAAAVACLAADLVMAVSGNSGLFDTLNAIAWGTPSEQRRGGMVAKAQNIDAQNAGGKRLALDELIAGWRNG